MEIKVAKKEDAPELADVFMEYVSEHTEYISHGEIQMGVGKGYIKDKKLVTSPSDDGREKWMKYILKHLENESFGNVWKVVEDGKIIGFGVAEIREDGDKPFGMVCDILLKDEYHNLGLGTQLLKNILNWHKKNGLENIFLESGINNSSAHGFFEKKGFVHISEIYKLDEK